MKKNFILEIITEELPPRNIIIVIKSFYKNIVNELRKKFIKYNKIKWYTTSRRLSIEINRIKYEKKHILKYTKKIKNNNLEKKRKIFVKMQNDLKIIIFNSIKKLNLVKSMHWNDSKIKFIRPIRNVLCMLDDKKVDIKILNVKSKSYTLSHFFMKNNKKIYLNNANEYKKKIKKYGKVIIDAKERKKKILTEIKKKIKKIDINLSIKKKNIEEINNTVEWPKIYIGKFRSKFLKIYKKLIKYVVETIQKCLMIYSKFNNIKKYFIIISNISSKNPSRIILENQNVINERLRDIIFFLKLDNKKKLINNLKKLKKYIFHKKLGTFFEKTIRIKKVSCWISKKIKIKKKDVIKASLLSKCDLLTNMVFEFPEMQGYIGMKYAMKENEKKKIAYSIKEQYYPLFYNSKIPKYKISCAISIADKIDTITGLFIVGEKPNSKNDPFYIRKSTIGIIRILLEKKLIINIVKLIKKSIFSYSKYKTKMYIRKKIIKYFKKRMLSILKKHNFKKCFILSSIKTCKMIPIIIYKNTLEISNYKNIEILKNTYKRIKNITSKIKNLKNTKINKNIINNKIEKKLYSILKIFEKKTKNMIKDFNYKNIFYYINVICKITNLLFKKIFINDKNKKIRINRILILKKVNKQFNKIIIMKYFL
ncbi:MAG: glycine--tRNA ligase subunit beta [Buchnera aphidicola (Ceratovacuna japonica)]